jgi:hypothetical protein
MRAQEHPSERVARRLANVERDHAEHSDEFDSIEHARSTGRAHAVFIGDCHVRYLFPGLVPDDAPPLIPHAWIDMLSVVSASARGLANPDSMSGALPLFTRRIELAQRWQPLIFMVGEADTGFLIWNRIEKGRGTIDELVEQSIDHYMNFLRDVHAQGFDKIIVLSSPATSAARYSDAGIHNPQGPRTELTLRYNDELARRADFFTFLDITTPTLDPATRLLAPDFIDPEDLDHVATGPWARVLADQLGPLLSPP